MSWVEDLNQKIRTLLDIEGVMTMQEDAFDYVEHQLQTVGNSIENQFQNVSANIEHQLQAFRANIQQYCPNPEFNVSKSVDTEIENMEQTALKSSACSLDLSGEKDTKPADVENKNIQYAKLTPALEKSVYYLNLSEEKYSKPVAVENNNNKNSNLAATALKKPSCSLDMSGEKDSKPANLDNKIVKDPDIADVESENIDPTAQVRVLFAREVKTLKQLPRYGESIPSEKILELARAEYMKTLAHEEYYTKKREEYLNLLKSGNYSSASDQIASNTDTSIPVKYSEESEQKKCVAPDPYVYPLDFKADVVIGQNDKKPTLSGTQSTIDNTRECSLCFKKFKSGSDKIITCEACAAKVESIDQQEQEKPTPECEVIDDGLNLSDDESFETADFDCDSDWEII